MTIESQDCHFTLATTPALEHNESAIVLGRTAEPQKNSTVVNASYGIAVPGGSTRYAAQK